MSNLNSRIIKHNQINSLVHMQNGKYQVHLRTINASAITDRNEFAFRVYSELLTAFSIID